MKRNTFKRPLLILAICIICIAAVLFMGYRIEKPVVETAEFPFSVTYEYQGETETFSGTYVCKVSYGTKYFGQPNRFWYGYVKEIDAGPASFILIHETDNSSLALCFSYDAAYLMGDSQHTSGNGIIGTAPYGEYFEYRENDELYITDPVELEKLGFRIISWTDLQPIENSLKPGGIMLSGEASLYLAVIMLAGVICCMLFVRKETGILYTVTDKLSITLNFLTGLLFFPYVTVVAVFNDLVPSEYWIDLMIYGLPCITLAGIAVSLVMRRKGYKALGLLSQLSGPVVLALVLMADIVA